MYKNLSFSPDSILVGMLELDALLLKVLTVAVDTMLLFPYGKKRIDGKGTHAWIWTLEAIKD